MTSLRLKLAGVFGLIVASMIVLAIIVNSQVKQLEERILIERGATILFDLVRETRYREFRAFQYRRLTELVELREAISNTEEFTRQQISSLQTVASPETLEQMLALLADYRKKIDQYWTLERFQRTQELPAEEEIRILRRNLVIQAEHIARTSQHLTEEQLTRQRTVLGTGLVLGGILLVGIGIYLFWQLVRPLRSLEFQMEEVAAGRATRVRFDSKDVELIALMRAFNHVMDELDRRRAAEVQSEKLAAMGTMLSGVAHELNNPLSNISTTVQILSEDLNTLPPEQLQPLLKRIDLQTERARVIVQTLLEHARITPMRDEVISVASLFSQARDAVNIGRSSARYILTDVAPGLKIKGTATSLLSVLVNLLQNAFDATPAEEPVALCARAVSEGERARVEIEVQDCGRGMTPQETEKALDPFFTTKPAGQGTGLGLFIVHDIVRQHGGTIHLISRPGIGTTVTLRFDAFSEPTK